MRGREKTVRLPHVERGWWWWVASSRRKKVHKATLPVVGGAGWADGPEGVVLVHLKKTLAFVSFHLFFLGKQPTAQAEL